jgi:ABC-type multidrug transport system fused ATPase/permease subunit
MITHHLHTFWSTPFQVTLALILLFQTLGIAALPGLIIMLSFLPISTFASHFQRRFQTKQMQLKDERIKMVNEILSGIKVVKFNAWENAMQKLVEGIREQELRCIRAHSLIRSALDCYNFSTPFLVALFSFATYIYMDGVLTPQIAFVSLALFNQLRMPLMTIGVLINLTVQVSLTIR